MTPQRLHRALALAEAVTWGLLLAGMLLKYGTGTTDVGVSIGGALHGFVVLAYCVGTVLVGTDQRWSGRQVLLGLACAVPPFATLPFERWARGRGLRGATWRLRGGRAPTGPVESVVAVALRRPFTATMATLAVLAVVFRAMVQLGPPTQWFA